VLKTRRISPFRVLLWGTFAGLPAVVWSIVIFALYAFADLHFLRVPFLPIATIGTAVAFYVGFKNNAAYERFWEGRKIWGGVVNSSRAWAAGIVAYLDGGEQTALTDETRRELLYRHLAWTNALRVQLRKNSRFFDKPARGTRMRLEKHAEHMRNDWDKEVGPFLSAGEFAEVSGMVNPATHLVLHQGQRLAALVAEGRLDLFRQLELMNILNELYDLQGMCERIKNTPFPRQYAEYSRVFTFAFVTLVPFGMLDVFADSIDLAVGADAWVLAIPMVVASALVTWVFRTMEGIGDMSEDPFERSMNDVPMNALCIAIERDLRQILGEETVPGPEQPADGILY
jgi:ion channel-forming bestrophin family protein